MAKKEEAQSNGAAAGPSTCCVEKCGKKGERMNFCSEHFGWFKEGLVNRQGKRPVDFDKKYQAFLRNKAA